MMPAEAEFHLPSFRTLSALFQVSAVGRNQQREPVRGSVLLDVGPAARAAAAPAADDRDELGVDIRTEIAIATIAAVRKGHGYTSLSWSNLAQRAGLSGGEGNLRILIATGDFTIPTTPESAIGV